MTGTLNFDILLRDHIDGYRRLGWNGWCENLKPIVTNLKKLSPKNRASRGLKSIVKLAVHWPRVSAIIAEFNMDCYGCALTRCLKAAVHWVRVNALGAESSSKWTWDAMGLRADWARWLSVRAEPLTRWGRAEPARNPIVANDKFSD